MRKLYMDKGEGTVVGKKRCPQCADNGEDLTGDNLVMYKQVDGTIDGNCFKCDKYFNSEKVGEVELEEKPSTKATNLSTIKMLPSIMLVDRNLKRSHTEFYGVKSRFKGSEEFQRYYPITVDGSIVGYKVRTLPKSFHRIGGGCNIEMFGQHKFAKGGKVLIITAGEEDAMSAYRITEHMSPTKRGYASVSLPNGASDVKAIKNNLEWIESFEKVVFAVDQEELDLSKAKEYCSMLSPGKGFVANYSEKDASDMCKAKKFSEFYQAIWKADAFTPSGIVEGAEVYEQYKKKNDFTAVPLPSSWGMGTFNYGLYRPSLVVIAAGTGVGKSTMIKHLQYHLFTDTVDGIGVISMEEPLHLCAGTLMGMYLNKRIMLPDVKVTEHEERSAAKALFETGRFVFCDNVGIRTPEDLYSKIRFMVNSRECKFIFLDHLTAIINKFGDSGNKNNNTEHLVNSLNDLSMELNVCLILVSHVRKTGEESACTYETGKVPTVDSIFGSGSIKQYASVIYTVSRDVTDSDSPCFIHVLKDRLSGRSGKSSPLFLDETTGWLTRTKSQTNEEEVL